MTYEYQFAFLMALIILLIICITAVWATFQPKHEPEIEDEEWWDEYLRSEGDVK